MRNQNVYCSRKGGLPTVTQHWEQRIVRHMKKMDARNKRNAARKEKAEAEYETRVMPDIKKMVRDNPMMQFFRKATGRG